ncbi:hypothetical protein WR25_07554 isoform F [Diploscapter pachys]|uniref:m7GpppX diphosphatase n=1 Tax=Diploscapter pachys TaxID=2018661 RepID=A0A2A2JRS7_9BILA|nr:hypothetical protein WR25_07554 isoform F [Diploscapter pachys]
MKMEVSTEEAAQKWLATAQFREILASDTSHKSQFVLLSQESGELGILLLNKSPFSEDQSVISEWIKQARLKEISKNDIYGCYSIQVPVEFNLINSQLIYPATEKHVQKYRAEEKIVIRETPEDYEQITKIYIEKYQMNLQWVYNILEKKAEAERVFYEEACSEFGWILANDIKWDGVTKENLYCLAIINRHDVRSIRDLRGSDVDFLEKLRDKSLKVIQDKYDVPANQLRAYFHYQPSFYHLHVHFVNIKYDAPGQLVYAAVSIEDVINNLRMASDYYQTHAAVLGLGDSSYQKFNFAGKRLFRRLEQLGARMLTQLGLADDQHEIGIDGALIPWKEAVWMRLYEEKIFENMKLEVDPTTVIPSKFILEPASIGENLNFHEEDQEYRLLTAGENRRVTADDHFQVRKSFIFTLSSIYFQDTRLIRFSVDDKDSNFFSYNPGDVLMVWPYNNDESMQIVIDALQYSDDLLDRPVHIRTNDRYLNPPPKWLVGDPTTLRSCLRRLLDLQAIPRRTFFEVFASLAVDEFEKRRLLELASPQGLDDLLAYANRVRRTTAETFRDFPVTSKSIPPERLFDLLKTIRPRAFSIASSPVVQGNAIELLVAKVQYKSRLSDPRRGLCSTFLSRLKPGDKVIFSEINQKSSFVQVFSKIRPGTFKFPPVEVPLICIGPGTGVAPFRSLLISRERLVVLRLNNRQYHSIEIQKRVFLPVNSLLWLQKLEIRRLFS